MQTLDNAGTGYTSDTDAPGVSVGYGDLPSIGAVTGAPFIGTYHRSKDKIDRTTVKKHIDKDSSVSPLRDGKQFRKYYGVACKAADALTFAAASKDYMGVAIAADEIEKALGELWKIRGQRDFNWQSIVNHTHDMMKSFFAHGKAELITAPQSDAISRILKDYIGTSTKTAGDLKEVLRLIDDAGFDPYEALTSDQDGK